MADVKVQNRPSEAQRGLARRPEYFPSRELGEFSPFTLMRRLSDEMDRAFASTFGLSRDIRQSGMWSPAIEVREHNNNLEITAELPGMKKEDIKVECTAEGIAIEGEKRHEQEETQGEIHRSERSYGHFYRMIPMPEGIQPDKVKAEFKDGVLHVRVPMPEGRQRREVPIET